VNLFSRLSEILGFSPDEPWPKRDDLETIFAQNRRAMEDDLMAVKPYAAALLAVERALARELRQQRAMKGPDRALRRLETEYRAALEHRRVIEQILLCLKEMAAEVCRKQRSILLRRTAFARLALRSKGPAQTAECNAVRARLQHLLDELSRFEQEWMVQVETSEHEGTAEQFNEPNGLGGAFHADH
jgi:hypothetical protein